MKQLIFILLLLIAAESAYATEFFSHKASREEYSPGETAQIELELLQQPEKAITPLNFALRDGAKNKVRVSSFFLRTHDNKYLIHFDIPEPTLDGNYEATVADALFKENGVLKKVEYPIPLKIKRHSPAISIFPAGVILDRKNAFTIRVYTLEQTRLKISSTAGINNFYATEQPLLPRTERIFKFSVVDLSGPEEHVQIDYGNYSYIVPVYIKKGDGQRPVVRGENATESIEFLNMIESIDREIGREQSVEGSFEINNSGIGAVSVNVELSEALKQIMDIEAPESIEAGKTAIIIVKINDEKSPEEDLYEGEIKLNVGRTSKIIPVKIAVREETVEPTVVPEGNASRPGEQPVTPPLFELNLTQTETQDDRSIAGIIVFLVILLVFALVVYALSRRTTKKKTFDEYIEEIQKK